MKDKKFIKYIYFECLSNDLFFVENKFNYLTSIVN